MDFDKISKELHLEISNELAVIQGGNSSVIKAKLKDNALIAVKIYKGEPSRVQRMLAREQVQSVTLPKIIFTIFQKFLKLGKI